jgi:hypothetical protein
MIKSYQRIRTKRRIPRLIRHFRHFNVIDAAKKSNVSFNVETTRRFNRPWTNRSNIDSIGRAEKLEPLGGNERSMNERRLSISRSYFPTNGLNFRRRFQRRDQISESNLCFTWSHMLFMFNFLRPSSSVPRIINGLVAFPGQAPWQV